MDDVASPALDIRTSEALYAKARHTIPGGVNSPARAFKSVGGTPLFIQDAQGTTLTDVDGNTYIDYVGSWGPMLFGHADPDTVAAVQDAATRSTSYGAPTSIEIDVAELVVDLVPSIDKVRMVNSGTEATMSAARVARGYTGRDKIIKFAGNYHGHGDFFLIGAGSGPLTHGTPDSPGVTEGNAKDTLLARYNDLDHVEQLLEAHAGEVACIIVEPIAGNMGCIPPEPGFLEGLRRLCDHHDALLIFDEVMTGFRVAPGGAQERYGVIPDLTTLGKIIGGGLPVGAYGGKQAVMDHVSPEGPVYQAGTLSGNPLAMHAGYTVLQKIHDRRDTLYDQLEDYAEALARGTRHNLDALGLSYYTTQVGAMGCLFFTERTVTDLDDAKACDTERYADYFHAMLEEGVYLAPSQFEAYFFGALHDEDTLDATLKAQRRALKRVH
ncbi:glutamate-1-semialdehyde 2,1-aminomutase [Salisaeta longa]|uniref:glutamate-1-semialdehyde 2,1-aminomutase n=1 Tax=Salisaeta longa TaxID=503170 RepID=UPI0003B779BF|nr:glutamate-1-semialdehyde 2,1-aminomutase [Salisaeta longa]